MSLAFLWGECDDRKSVPPPAPAAVRPPDPLPPPASARLRFFTTLLVTEPESPATVPVPREGVVVVIPPRSGTVGEGRAATEAAILSLIARPLSPSWRGWWGGGAEELEEGIVVAADEATTEWRLATDVEQTTTTRTTYSCQQVAATGGWRGDGRVGTATWRRAHIRPDSTTLLSVRIILIIPSLVR